MNSGNENNYQAEDRKDTLTTLISKAAGWDAEFSEIRVDNIDNLMFCPNAVIYKGVSLPLDKGTQLGLLRCVGGPEHYWSEHTPAFQAKALMEHARKWDFGHRPLLVHRNQEELVTITRGDLHALPISDVVRAIEQGVGENSPSLFVSRIGRAGLQVDIELVSPSKALAVRPGDIVQSGLHISHQRYGGSATLIEAFIYRLVCSNGLVKRQCVHGGGRQSRIRRLPAKMKNSHELQMEQVRRLARETWDGLEVQLERLQATSERPANVMELLQHWLEGARFSWRNIEGRVHAAWQKEDSENTYYGAVNTLSRLATHEAELSDRQRRTLASLAGLLALSGARVCPKCFSVLARNQQDSEAAA